MSRTPLKSRLLAPLMAVMFLMLIAVTGAASWMHRSQMERDIGREIDEVADEFQWMVRQDAELMGASLSVVTSNQELQRAFAQRDRDRLLQLSQSVYERLNRDHRITHLYFTDPQRQVILRVHNPPQYGDVVNRWTTLEAERTGNSTFGMELGRFGTFTLRTVHPWYEGDELLGYIELGEEVEHLIHHLGKVKKSEVTILIHKAFLREKDWEEGRRMLGHKAAWNEYGEHVIINPTPFPADQFVRQHEAGSTDDRVYQLVWEGQSYRVCVVPLRDAAGAEVGHLMIPHETTAAMMVFYRGIAVLVMICLGASVILFAVFYGLFDRTEKALAQSTAQLRDLAMHDRLTGLLNRGVFLEHLQQVLGDLVHDEKKMAALLFLDLDRFKVINDSLGHEAGDDLLMAVAERLQAFHAHGCVQGLSKGSHVARLGGDEFVLLLDNLDNLEQATGAVACIQQRLGEPYRLGGRDIVCTSSIGIATTEDFGGDAKDLLRNADTALYRAKALGKNRHAVFNKAMHDSVIAHLEVESDLHQALHRQEVSLDYQPIIALDSGKLAGFEALLRWRHPVRGNVPPDQFIPIAEENGLILALGEWALGQACQQLAAWRKQAPELADLYVTVNVSRVQLASLALPRWVERVLESNGLSPGNLRLEVTESVMLQRGPVVNTVLRQLQALEVPLYMDDFGTGHSSLSQLHELPMQAMKIDRAFIANITKRREYPAIIQAIVELAHNLDLTVIAEGIETAEQLAVLQALDCDQAQGYFFSKPLPAEQVHHFLKQVHASVLANRPSWYERAGGKPLPSVDVA
jgi:diguanylate cyclase (GGDEF)-like protein